MYLRFRMLRSTSSTLSALAILAGFALLLPVDRQALAAESRFEGLEYRSIGPFRGGRAAAVTGVPGERNLYYGYQGRWVGGPSSRASGG